MQIRAYKINLFVVGMLVPADEETPQALHL